MKKITLFSILALFLTTGISQTFMHGAGVGIFVADAPNSDASAAGVLTYSPRINFIETETLSLSAGIPLSVGFSGSYNYSYSSYYGSDESNTIRFMFNAPLLINLNLGAGSTKENEKRIGFFVGGGFGYHYGQISKITTDEYGNENYGSKYGSSYGPAGNIGMRFAVGSHQKNIEARLSFMKAISDSKVSVYGVAALFNF